MKVDSNDTTTALGAGASAAAVAASSSIKSRKNCSMCAIIPFFPLIKVVGERQWMEKKMVGWLVGWWSYGQCDIRTTMYRSHRMS